MVLFIGHRHIYLKNHAKFYFSSILYYVVGGGGFLVNCTSPPKKFFISIHSSCPSQINQNASTEEYDLHTYKSYKELIWRHVANVPKLIDHLLCYKVDKKTNNHLTCDGTQVEKFFPTDTLLTCSFNNSLGKLPKRAGNQWSVIQVFSRSILQAWGWRGC